MIDANPVAESGSEARCFEGKDIQNLGAASWTQAAALLGVGLLYQGSNHRLTAEILLVSTQIFLVHFFFSPAT